MKRIVKTILAAVMIAGIGLQAAEKPILKVTSARQRYPWNGLVDINCKVKGLGNPPVLITVTDKNTGEFLPVNTLTLDGKKVENGRVKLHDGDLHFIWDAGKDVEAGYVASNILVRVTNGGAANYLVIDLSGGTSAESYPVDYFASVPEGGWQNEHKTTKLVLRKIMPSMLPGGNINSNLRISEPFRIGIFEVTQKQYELVMGSNPSYYKGDARPVECVSWNTINASDGFLARLSQKTGLTMVLPSDKQWEYACRAGTTTSFNNGTSSIAGLGRYSGNQDDGKGGYSQHTTVGSYAPNAWGLYDMHGNVWEWCADLYSSSESNRVLRGGSWNLDESYCTSSYRDGDYPSNGFYNYGFRLACSPGH